MGGLTINRSKNEYFEVWFIEHHDHHVIDDNFTKLYNEIGEKLKNEKIKAISTTRKRNFK